ncbi:hypothetical protein DAPPUDRAFT_103837 [Daphnia pulex]|uniref:Uncharacterized protein n=1 Tax=Daphnia pulex TaxID=6669 RepID=E9GKH8_DAPPU|nr:hypothetical protein DAPPUDRAFT_103837 [Daphnia pulex]|eukprot:EFX80061.1 hypothetical protein DAPPUDRAFT_103837 [Daphnia pulex]
MGFQFLPSRLSIIIDIRYDIPLITVHVFCFRPCDFAAAGGHGRAPEASPGNAAAAAPEIASAAGRGRAPEAAPGNAAAAAPVFAAAAERDQAPNAAPGIAAAGERGQALNAAPGNAAAPGIAPAAGGRGRAPNAAPANAAAPGIAAAAGPVAEGRGRALAAAAERARAPAAAPGNAAAAAPGIADPAAHLRPRPADAPLRCHRGVLYDLFKFLKKHVGAAAITNSFEIEGGSRTKLTVLV